MKSRKMVVWMAVAIAVIAAGLAMLTAGIVYKLDEQGKLTEDTTTYRLEIQSEDFAYEISNDLKDNGIIRFARSWRSFMEKNYPDFVYINGEYEMTGGMTYEEIAEKLQNPDVSHKTVKVTVPEGSDVFQIAEILEKNNICTADDFYKAVSDKDYDYDWIDELPDPDTVGFVLEGFLFPATYDFGENSDARDVVNTMLAAFDDRLSDSILQQVDDSGYSLFEIVTLASIIQEEALSEDSKANISSVLHNRLEQGIKLQCDVTYYYGAKLLDYGFSRSLYDTYYTYRCEGLPAGPISSPGLDMIEAALNPTDTDYLYFFSDLNGDFHFAATGEEFEAQKAQYPWQ